MTDSAFDITLGIDIGTTFSCVAFAHIKGREIYAETFDRLDERGLVPSLSLYGYDYSISPALAHGSEALASYLKGDGAYLVREFKMKLGGTLVLDYDLELDAQTVYANYLAFLRHQIEKQSGPIASGRICLTCPAESAKNRYRYYIEEAAAHVFSGEGFEIIVMNEPAAVVQFVDRTEGFLTSKPHRILIVDSGGGTTDFALAEARYSFIKRDEPLRLGPTHSIDIGGRNIDRSILQEIEDRKDNIYIDYRQREEFLEQIRQAKDRYSWNGKQIFRVSLGDYIAEVDPHLVNQIASGVIYKIAFAVQDFMLEKGQVEMIVLAGGNTRIPFFEDAIREFLPGIKIKSVKSNELKTAVAKGAALFARTTYQGIKYQTAYEIVLKYPSGRAQKLWKRGAILPHPRNNMREIVARARDGVFAPSLILIGKNGEQIDALLLEFTQNDPQVDSRLRIQFEIDANGYLRWAAKPMGRKQWDQGDFLAKSLIEPAERAW